MVRRSARVLALMLAACGGRSSPSTTPVGSPPAAEMPAAAALATAAAPAAPATPAASTAPDASAAPAATARPSHLLVHMDHAPVAKVAEVQASRKQQVEWIKSHGAAIGEATTYWVRVGAERVWAARPATSWEEVKGLGQRLGKLEDAIVGKVGEAFAANEDRMHQAIAEHHNELLRPNPRLTLSSDDAKKDATTDLAQLASLRLVAIDKPIPARADDYLAAIEKINTALRTAEPSLWRAVYFSSMGSGAYVHFIGAARALSPSQLDALTARALSVSLGEAEAKRLLAALAASLAQHELVEASLDLERSTLP